jgi:hypothetical protein
MDNIATYNSDINVLRENIKKNNKTLSELEDTSHIQKIKNYEGINDEVNNLLYREKIVFGITGLVAISATIVTFKMI